MAKRVLAIPGLWGICRLYIGSDWTVLFQQTCDRGVLEDARWLWSLGLTLEDIRANDNDALRWACDNGHESVARGLWSLGLTLKDIRAQSNYALREARANGHESVTRWLLSLGLDR